MSLREQMNHHPAASGAVAVVLIVGAVAGVWYSMRPTVHGKPTKAYYTVDDGQTWFADSIDKQTPFEHEGQEAVKAYVYTCDGGKSRFVAYLEKMPPGAQAHAQVEGAPAEPPLRARNEAEARALAAKQPRKPGPGQFLTLVKKPGDKQWLTSSDPGYFPTIVPKCANTALTADRVFP